MAATEISVGFFGTIYGKKTWKDPTFHGKNLEIPMFPETNPLVHRLKILSKLHAAVEITKQYCRSDVAVGYSYNMF